MDACLAVEREQEKVLKKLRTLSGSSADKLQKLIDQIIQLREQLGRVYYFYLVPTMHKICASITTKL